jgi:chemotaxis protein MotB
LPSERLQAISYGETRPVDDNNTAAGREKNRRIEIEIEF